MSNVIQILELRRVASTWVFDDRSKGIKNEPFVAGVPTVIDQILLRKQITDSSVMALFSGEDFPGTDVALEFEKLDKNGAWYQLNGMRGWFCPCFWNYFDKKDPPKKLYISLERVN